jgi:hypothetical protein
MVCDGKASFIDFGSTWIDDYSTFDFERESNDRIKPVDKVFRPNRFLYPFGLKFFIGNIIFTKNWHITTFFNNVFKQYEKSPSIGYGLLDKYMKVSQKEVKQVFAKYVIHKNECYALAVTLFQELNYQISRDTSPPLAGGWCFKSQILPKDDDDKINKDIANYRKYLDDRCGKLGKLLYFDIDDFLEFNKDYSSCQSGGKQKKYIKMKETKKVYVLREDADAKYIMLGRQKRYLRDLRNKYIYTI